MPRCCRALSIAVLGQMRSHWFSKGSLLIPSCILMAALAVSSTQWSPFCRKCSASSISFIHHQSLFLFSSTFLLAFPFTLAWLFLSMRCLLSSGGCHLLFPLPPSHLYFKPGKRNLGLLYYLSVITFLYMFYI